MEQELKQVCPSTSGFHIRISLCDEAKIDKLINWVQFLVLICIIIAVVMFFWCSSVACQVIKPSMHQWCISVTVTVTLYQ
jgi:hypothetical protein